ncbi:MAG: CoA transferase [Caulobacteraceae bacterium]|nr:CoA transferase [Caulobacteraceae bacterium]
MLGDLRVVEIGEGMAVQVAGLMLCELGAQVLKIERPGGDPSRGQATFANWNRGKRSLELDLGASAGRRELAGRLAGADVLIHQFTPRRAAALRLDDASLASAHPRLVVCAVTGSPNNHPDVERSDDELLVAARLGALYENDGYRAGPIALRYRMGSWGAAHLAAAGVLARLVMRLQCGRGGPAHTSILQGLLSSLPLVWGRNSAGPMPNPQTYAPGPRPQDTQLFECAGGAWMQVMDPTRQFDFASLPTMWGVLAEGAQIDTAQGLKKAFRRRPIDAWIADLRAADVAVEPAYPMGEVLRLRDVRLNGYVVEVDDPQLGPTTQPNVPFHCDVDLPRGRAAPRLGEGGADKWRDPPAPIGRGGKPDRPLSGVRVADFGMFLAGPMGPSMMGDMGADVIKVEALTGDRIRFMHRYYQAAARSKRSLALDLARPEAKEVLARLLRWAEVAHHNLRAKGADKLGLSEAALRSSNPDIVFSYVSAYGQRGERSNWPGYDSIFTAIAGWEFENAGEGNPPLFCRPGPMDVLAAQNCLVGTMAALYAQRALRPGRHVATSLLGVAAFSQGERLILADGSLSETYHLDAGQTGFGPYHRLFETRDGWVALAAHTEARKRGVRAVLGEDEANFDKAAKLCSSTKLMAALEAQGVPCDLVNFEDAMNRFFDDPRNREAGLVSALDQPLYGLVEQPGAFWNFVDTPLNIVRCCPGIGQHTDEIMRELGYSEREVAALRKKKVIG